MKYHFFSLCIICFLKKCKEKKLQKIKIRKKNGDK